MIKWYVRLGYDISEGQDIEEAIKDIREATIANIEPNRKEKRKKPLMAGISNWFEFQ